ncbi:MAG: DUF177 domain-containing protein [candidate division Zixibacteria bacterium]|nr:DUF177 domain-containing protein [candidate division Zixibacteria bacterium]
MREFSSFPVEFVLESEGDNLEGTIEGITFRDVIKLKINLQKVKEEYLLHGVVKAPVDVECSRCLEMYESELVGELDVLIKTTQTKAVMASDSSEDCIYLKQNEHIVDLTDMVRQTLTLALPMKPVCNEECKGLCPNCGVNLNEETCDCSPDEFDERWDGLRNLLE